MTLSLARRRASFSAQQDEGDAPFSLSSLFRSKTYPKAGATRQPGNMHMHLDCSKSPTSETRLVEIAKALEGHGWPSKVSRVNLARGGLHLSDPEYASEYAEHTPELCAGENTFAAYLTTLMSAEVTTPQEAAKLCAEARKIMGLETNGFSEADVVIEIERVTALIDTKTVQVATPTVFSENNKSKHALFEIHHLVDLPKTASIEFDEWQALCNLSGIVVGGWFRFDKESGQALRSVRFSRDPDSLKLIAETRELEYIVREHIGIEDIDIQVQTVVEQVIDIWRL